MKLQRRRRIGLILREAILLEYKECIESVKHYRRETGFAHKHAKDCYMIYRVCKFWNGQNPTGFFDLAYIKMADRFYKVKSKKGGNK